MRTSLKAGIIRRQPIPILSPRMIPSCVAWFDPSYGGGYFSGSDRVLASGQFSVVRDLTGNVRDLSQGTANIQPALSTFPNGRECMLFMRRGTLAYDNQVASPAVNFSVGETVTQGGSPPTATGVVESDSDAGTTGTLTLTDVTGTFTDNSAITGLTSGSTALVNAATGVQHTGDLINLATAANSIYTAVSAFTMACVFQTSDLTVLNRLMSVNNSTGAFSGFNISINLTTGAIVIGSRARLLDANSSLTAASAIYGSGNVSMILASVNAKTGAITMQVDGVRETQTAGWSAVLPYDSQDVAFTNGETLTGAQSGASAVLLTHTDAGAYGILTLTGVPNPGLHGFLDDEELNGSVGSPPTSMAAVDFKTNPAPATAVATIGRNSVTGGFAGKFGDAAYWQRELSADEALGLRLYWHNKYGTVWP